MLKCYCSFPFQNRYCFCVFGFYLGFVSYLSFKRKIYRQKERQTEKEREKERKREDFSLWVHSLNGSMAKVEPIQTQETGMSSGHMDTQAQGLSHSPVFSQEISTKLGRKWNSPD